MGGEASFAGILQDLSLVFPPSAELTSMSINLAEAVTAPAPGGDRLVYGRISATGEVVSGLSPGVERLLIDFSRAASFDNSYITSSSVNDDGVATFSLETELGPEVLTRRYLVSMEATP